ncbi:MAG: DAK2 domain-containing protein [Tepidanaerobacteraceae bacterium]|nr:DAK2 domain-containing protein [Tepidanaerobacteraceae bacterium]
MNNIIEGHLFKKAFIHGANNLRVNKKVVDALNVFPVPDGDTGTNMSLTMDKAVAELEKVQSDDIKKIVDAVAWGSLMGARGNSGVILSQLFRGFSQYISSLNKKSISSNEFAQAFKCGVDSAYRAVMRPVEGTILTVAREMADKMLADSRKMDDMGKVLDGALEYGEKVLEKTPEMLKVLKEAKVVDAGGKGLIFFMSGFMEAIKNPDSAMVILEQKTESKYDSQLKDINEVIKYSYCTELFIKGRNIDFDSLKQELSELGDSIIVTGMYDTAKIHIHSNHPGKVLETALKWGELSNIKIDNMKIQHREFINGEYIDAANDKVETAGSEANAEKTGIVAVSQGEGLKEIFLSLGADIVIEGGQTMNPSTENILSAIEKEPFENIIILPNNKNIIMTAEQAKLISSKKVHVLPTRSVPQGIAALLAFNPVLSVEDNLASMSKNIKNVATGEVTYAVRDSQWNGTVIRQGDVIGIKDGNISVVEKDKEKVLMALIDDMLRDRASGIITIYYGKDVDSDSMRNIYNKLSARYTDFDIEYYYGGQSLYHYIVSVE